MTLSYHHTRADFKLIRGVRNDIDILVRDVDRQPVAIADGEQIFMTIINPRFSRIILRQALTPVTPAKGQYRFTISAADVNAFDLGMLSYQLTLVRSSGEVMLFNDRDHGISTGLEIIEGPYPALPDPITIMTGDMMSGNGGYYAGPYAGSVAVGNHTGVQSLAIYTVNFTGTILVDGSVETQAPGNEGWFSAGSLALVSSTGTSTLSVTGNLTWVRIRVTTVTGLTKIIYRN